MYPHNPLLVRAVGALPMFFSTHQVDWSMLDKHPLTRPELRLGSDFVAANRDRWLSLFAIARCACVPFSLLGGWLCWRWASSLYGGRAGFTALATWCFAPSVLGSAHAVGPDVAAAALGLGAVYGFSKWLARPSWRWAFTAGLILGLAELAKFTWLVLFGLFPLLWCARLTYFGDWIAWRHVHKEAAQLCLVLILAVWTINAGYGFSRTMKPLGEYTFFSKALSGTTFPRHSVGDGANRFAGTWSGNVPIPIPEDFLKGIDLQKREFELGYRSYLRGQWRDHGWWYYYFYTLAVKLPLGILLLFGLALCRRLRLPLTRRAMLDELVLLTPAVVVFGLVSSQTSINSYHRYVLPALPFAFVWMSQLAESKDRRVRYVVPLLVSWSTLSSLAVFPHFGSYFNVLAGGPDGGPKHLVDSNVGWGQDLIFLKQWLDARPEAQPLGLAYYGTIDPRDVGIEFFEAPKGGNCWRSVADCPGSADVIGPLPGWYAIDVSFVHGLRKSLPDGQGGWNPYWVGDCDLTYFSRFEPVARAGYSIYIYRITREQANRVRRELGIEEIGREAV